MAQRAPWGFVPRRRRQSAAAAWRVAGAAVYFILAGLAFPAPALAQYGGQPGAFLNFGVGARALAMGGAFTAVSDDASAAFWNPSGLAQLQRKEATAMDASLYEGASLLYLGYAQPTKNSGTFGVDVAQLSASGFEAVNAVFNANGTATSITSGGSFSNTQQAMALSWGKAVTDKTNFGATLDYLSNSLDGSVSHFETVDLGMMRRFGFYNLGLDFQNVFEEATGGTSDRLPPIINLGNAVNLFHNRLTVSADLNENLTGGNDIRFGGEYWVAKWFAARFGLMGLPSIQETDFGFGFKFSGLMLDFAEGLQSSLGASTRVSLTFRFGESTLSQTRGLVQNFLRQGFDAFRRGDFALAGQKFRQALQADPTNQKAKLLLARLMAVTDYVPQAMGSQEYQLFTRKGAIAYVQGVDIHAAINDLRYAYNKNPKDEKLLGLLNMVEKEAGVEITRRVEGPGIFTWVDQKVYDTRQAVYQGQYSLAVRRAQDILDIEPNNVTALEMMGSAFYMMNDKEKAMAVWKKVLELDPNNKEVRQFMESVRK